MSVTLGENPDDITINTTPTSFAPVTIQYTSLMSDLGDTINSVNTNNTLTYNLNYANNPQATISLRANNSSNPVLSSSQITELNYDLGNLLSLAENGVNGEYLTPAEANQLQALMFFLSANGTDLTSLTANGSLQATSAQLQAALALTLSYSNAINQVQVHNLANIAYYFPPNYNANGFSQLPYSELLQLAIANTSYSPTYDATDPLNLNNVFGNSTYDFLWATDSTNTVNAIVTDNIIDNAQITDYNSAAAAQEIIDLASVPTAVQVSASPSASFSNYFTDVANILNDAYVAYQANPSSTLSSQQIDNLNSAVGQLVALAQAGSLSASQVTNLNLILTTLDPFSNVNGSGNTLSSGWSLDTNNNLLGVSSPQWQAWDSWMNTGITSVPNVSSSTPLAQILQNANASSEYDFSLSLLPPTSTGSSTPVGSFGFSVNASLFGNSSLSGNFTTALATFNSSISSYYSDTGSMLQQTDLANANTALTTLFNYAENGDGFGNYLTSTQLNQLVSAVEGVNSNATMGAGNGHGLGLASIAGVPTLVPFSLSNLSTSPINLSGITSVLQTIYSTPTDGEYQASGAQITALGTALTQLYTSINAGTLSLTQLGQALPVFQSLSNASSLFSPVTGANPTSTESEQTPTPGWTFDTVHNTLVLDSGSTANNTAQWQAWIQEIADDPSALGPAATGVLPNFSYTIPGADTHSAAVSTVQPANNAISTQFNTLINQLQTDVTAIDNAGGTVTSANLTNVGGTGLNDTLNSLISLAINGDGHGNYLSQTQAQTLNNILQSVNAVSGVNANSFSGTKTGFNITQAQNWFASLTALNNSIATATILDVTTNPVALLTIAGALTPVETVTNPTTTNTNYYNDALNAVATVIQQALSTTNSGLTGSVFTVDQLAALNQNVGELMSLASGGNLSYSQVSTLNILFQSLSNVSSVQDSSSAANENVPVFANSITSGWSTGTPVANPNPPPATLPPLTGVSDFQWQAWLQGIVSDPSSLSGAFTSSQLLPSTTITVGTLTYTGIPESPISSQPASLTNSFNTYMQTLNTEIQKITAGSVLQVSDIQAINSSISAILTLAIQGDGNGNYLSATQLNTFEATVNAMTTGSFAAFLDVAGMPSYTLLGTGNSNFAGYITDIESQLRSAFAAGTSGSPPTYTFTPAEITAISGDLSALVTISHQGNTVGSNDLTAAQATDLATIFSSLSSISSSAVLPTTAANYTSGWNVGSSTFLTSSAAAGQTNAVQFNDWLNEIATNLNGLSPAIPVSALLPSVTYQNVLQSGQPVSSLINLSADPTVTASYNSAISSIQTTLLQAEESGTGALTGAQQTSLDNQLQALINLAVNGETDSHTGNVAYLDALQSRLVGALFNSIASAQSSPSPLTFAGGTGSVAMTSTSWGSWFTSLLNSTSGSVLPSLGAGNGYGLGLVDIAGEPTLVPYSLTNTSTTPLNLTSLTSILQNIYSNPVDGEYQATGSQITALGTALAQLYASLSNGSLSLTQLTDALPVFQSLANVSSLFSPVTGANPTSTESEQTTPTPGWVFDTVNNTLVLDPSSTTNNGVQWQAWIQEIADDPDILGPAASGILPSFTYTIPGASTQAAPVSTLQPENNDVTTQFNTLINQLQTDITGIVDAGGTVTAANLTNANGTGVNDTLHSLVSLAINGDGNGNYISQTQAQTLNVILQSLNSVPGVNVDSFSGTDTGLSVTQAQNWYNGLGSAGTILDLTGNTVAFLTIAGETTTVQPNPSPSTGNTTAYNNALAAIAGAIQQAMSTTNAGLTGSQFTGSEISTLNQNAGILMSLATQGDLSVSQLNNLNVLFQSLSNVSSVQDSSIVADENTPVFANSLTTGWSSVSGSPLTGVSDFQWQAWLQGVANNPESLSGPFTPYQLLPSDTISVGSLSYTVPETPVSSQPSSLTTSFNTDMATLNTEIQKISAGSVLQASDMSAINSSISGILTLAIQGNGNGYYLTAVQLNAFQTAVSSMPTGSFATFLDVAGMPSYALLGPSPGNSTFTNSLDDIELQLQTAFITGNALTPPSYSLTAAEVTAISGDLTSLLTIAGGGNGASNTNLSASQAADLNTILTNLSGFSSSAVLSTTAANFTTGWTLGTSTFLTSSTVANQTNTVQFNNWLNAIAVNPYSLAPAIPATALLPPVTYSNIFDVNGNPVSSVINLVADPTVTTSFDADISSIQTLLAAAANTGALTIPQQSTLNAQVTNLINLAVNGEPDPSLSNNVAYLDQAQANTVATLFNSITGAAQSTSTPLQYLSGVGSVTMQSTDWTNWFTGLLNATPANIPAFMNYTDPNSSDTFDPLTFSFNIGGTPVNYPITLSDIGTLTTQADFNSTMGIITSFETGGGATLSQANAALQALVSLIQNGDANGNVVTEVEAASASSLFVSLNLADPNWSTNISGLTAANWSGLAANSYSSAFGIVQSFINEPTTVGFVAPPPTSTSSPSLSDLNTALQTLYNLYTNFSNTLTSAQLSNINVVFSAFTNGDVSTWSNNISGLAGTDWENMVTYYHYVGVFNAVLSLSRNGSRNHGSSIAGLLDELIPYYNQNSSQTNNPLVNSIGSLITAISQTANAVGFTNSPTSTAWESSINSLFHNIPFTNSLGTAVSSIPAMTIIVSTPAISLTPNSSQTLQTFDFAGVTVYAPVGTSTTALDGIFNNDVSTLSTLMQEAAQVGFLTGTYVSSSLGTQIDSAVGQLLALAQNGDGNGNYLTSTEQSELSSLFPSLAAVSNINTTSTDPANTTGWGVTSTNQAGVIASNLTGVTTDQLNSWLASLVSNPSQQTLFPSSVFKVTATTSITASVATTYNNLVQQLSNVITGIASSGTSQVTFAGSAGTNQVTMLNSTIAGLMVLASGGALTPQQLSNVQGLLQTLNATFVGNSSDTLVLNSDGSIAISDGTTTTDLQGTDWAQWLSTVFSNPSSLSPLLPSNFLTPPFVTITPGGTPIGLSYSVNTSSDVTDQYNTDIGDIENMLKASSTGFNTALSSGQMTNLEQDVGSLLYLAQFGDGQGNFLTTQMGQNVATLVNSLTASGFTFTDFTIAPIPSNTTPAIASNLYTMTPLTTTGASDATNVANYWNVWRDLALSSNMLQAVFASITQPISTNVSIQAMIELDYVTEGNNMLAAQLSNLQSALNSTQTVLNTLTGLQNLHNQLTVSTKIAFSTYFQNQLGGQFTTLTNNSTAQWTNPVTGIVSGGSSGVGYEAAYKYYASAYFNTPITPTIPNGNVVYNVTGNLALLASAVFTQGIIVGHISTIGYTANVFQDSGIAGALSPGAVIYTGDYILVPPGKTISPALLTAYNLVESDSYTVNFPATNPLGNTFPIFNVGANSDPNPSFVNSNGGDVFFAQNNTNSNAIPAGYTAYITQDQLSNVGLGSQVGSFDNSFSFGLSPRPTRLRQINTFAPGLSALVSALAVARADGYTYTGSSSAGTAQIKNASGDPVGAAFQAAGATGTVNTAMQTVLTNLLYDKAILSAQLAILSGLSASAFGNPNSLFSMASSVYDDLKKALTVNGQPVTNATTLLSAYPGISNWLLDGYNTQAATQGNIQQKITFAVTAAESLNSQQQQNVSNFLYIFEEFEKSAAAMLQQITQIIQNIAQNIAH